MTSNQWPWSPEEELKWEDELRRSEIEKVGELIEHLMSNGLGSAAYDPLEPQEDWEDQEILAP